MTAIQNVSGRRVWDSRGNPTVEAEITLENGVVGRAIAPAGASRGTREAMDLRDGGKRLRGMDVQGALSAVNNRIAPNLVGLEIADQQGIDRAMLDLDPSPLKSELGGNATISVSLAAIHAAAADVRKPLWSHIAETWGYNPRLPLPEIQVFGGGAHAAQRVDIQDFMIMVPGASDFDEVMEITSEVYFAAGDIMRRRGKLAGVADEGGWWPEFGSNEEALETLVQAIENAGEKPGERVVISLDVAASEFGSRDRYRLALEDQELDSAELIELLGKWLDDYPIASIEDPLAEDDVEGMVEFTRRFGDRVQIIGDDYVVTNAHLIKQAARDGACNTALLKVNQVGTVSETLAAYNAGPARVAAMRREAAESGYDPNLWFDNVEIIAARRIGRETVTYVSNVFKYYVGYQLMAERQRLHGDRYGDLLIACNDSE